MIRCVVFGLFIWLCLRVLRFGREYVVRVGGRRSRYGVGV